MPLVVGRMTRACLHVSRSKSLAGPNTGAYFVGSAGCQFHQDRQWVWARYGTTYRAMYTLYEITFAGRVQIVFFLGPFVGKGLVVPQWFQSESCVPKVKACSWKKTMGHRFCPCVSVASHAHVHVVVGEINYKLTLLRGRVVMDSCSDNWRPPLPGNWPTNARPVAWFVANKLFGAIIRTH